MHKIETTTPAGDSTFLSRAKAIMRRKTGRSAALAIIPIAAAVATLSAPSTLAGSGGATPTLLHLDEGSFLGWGPGIADQSSSVLLEEANSPAARAVQGSNYIANSFAATSLQLETDTLPMDITAQLIFRSRNLTTSGLSATKYFNIYEDGGTLSDILSVTFTTQTTNQILVNAHFNSDSLIGGSIAAYFGGTAINESGMNDSLNVLAPGWLPTNAVDGFTISPADFDLQFRSDVSSGVIPEPGTIGFGATLLGISAGSCLLKRHRKAQHANA